MREIAISFNKDSIVKLFRSKAFKVAEAYANDENFKAVYNMKHGGAEDIVDTRISDSLYTTAVGMCRAILAEYTTRTYEVGTDNVDNPAGVILNVPQTSTATQAVLTPAVNEYVTENMLAGWICDVAPKLADDFGKKVNAAEDNIKRIIYTKKAPTP